MKKISLKNSHTVLYSLSDPVRNLSQLVGAEAPIHLLLAGSRDNWNRGFDFPVIPPTLWNFENILDNCHLNLYIPPAPVSSFHW
jgi:hypothetical protein